jgi:hypothetical protein
MGKRGWAEDKGKGEDDDLIGFSVFRFKNSKWQILKNRANSKEPPDAAATHIRYHPQTEK